jgi:uncharacterized protein involved in exopolysaccharide biosynthesis
VLYATLLEQKQRIATVIMESTKVASVSVYAVTPQDKVSPKVLVNAVLAAIGGLFLGVLLVLSIEWWTSSNKVD